MILLDELLQKGYGLGSGISLFIATAESAVPEAAGVVLADAGALERSVTGVDDAGAMEVIVLREMLDIEAAAV